jgi:hypothetical protein
VVGIAEIQSMVAHVIGMSSVHHACSSRLSRCEFETALTRGGSSSDNAESSSHLEWDVHGIEIG